MQTMVFTDLTKPDEPREEMGSQMKTPDQRTGVCVGPDKIFDSSFLLQRHQTDDLVSVQICSTIVEFPATIESIKSEKGSPRKFVMIPPASCTMSSPAATSHGFKFFSQ